MTKMLWALLLACFALSSHAEIDITTTVTHRNPTIYLASNDHDASFNTSIKRKLIYSDWFSLSDKRDQAVYVLSIQGSSPAKIRLQDQLGNTVSNCGFDINLSKLNSKWRAHLIIDELIKRFFKSNRFPDPRICASQIAFSAWSAGKKEIYLCDVMAPIFAKKPTSRILPFHPNGHPITATCSTRFTAKPRRVSSKWISIPTNTVSSLTTVV